MAFLKPDDYIILMDWNDTPQNPIPDGYALSLDDLKKIKDLGINTLMVQTYWNTVEPSMGTRDWGIIDALVEKYRAAHLRAMLMAPVLVPTDAPDDYYFKYGDGTLEKAAFSIWNEEAMELQREYLGQMVKRYAASDIQIILGELAGGEYLLPLRAAFYDDSALMQFGAQEPDITDPHTIGWLRESVLNHYLCMQKELVEQHQEIWDAMHHYIAYWHPSTGNQFQTDLHAAYHDEWPDADVVLLQYTFMYHASNTAYITHINNLKDMGAKIIIEANYTSGLKDSTPLAISRGFAGQLCAPIHPYAPIITDFLRPKQIEAMSDSLKLWRQSRGGH